MQKEYVRLIARNDGTKYTDNNLDQLDYKPTFLSDKCTKCKIIVITQCHV